MAKRGSIRTEKVGLPPVEVPKGVVVGAHMSIADGTWKAVERGRALGCTAVQLFVKNASRWEGKPLANDEGKRFDEARLAAGNPLCFAHNSYLINLAAPDETLYAKSIKAMVDELNRCATLGLPGLVAHPGAHLGTGEETGLNRVASALDMIFQETTGIGVQVWLETTAGQGSSLGFRFEHLSAILDRVSQKNRVGVCVDTCHLFAAGYDLRTSEAYRQTMLQFAEVVGFEWLRAVHVNDSKGGLGSRVDRHEHLGRGKLGRDAFCFLMRDERLAQIPKVLETPKGDTGEKDWENLELLLTCAE